MLIYFLLLYPGIIKALNLQVILCLGVVTTSSVGQQQSVQSVHGASGARSTPPVTILNTPNPLRPLSIQTTVQQGNFNSKVVLKAFMHLPCIRRGKDWAKKLKNNRQSFHFQDLDLK